jgi:hypothetical protein
MVLSGFLSTVVNDNVVNSGADQQDRYQQESAYHMVDS